MLQIKSKEPMDILRLTEILNAYKISARVSATMVTIEDEVESEMLEDLYEILDSTEIEIFLNATEPLSSQPRSVLQSNVEELDLRYKVVKRGEVYWCDLGEGFGFESRRMKPVVIIQNDIGNKYALTTIVLPIMLDCKKDYPFQYSFDFYDSSIEYVRECGMIGMSVVCGEQIRAVDKRRLRSYIGTMTPEFMKEVQRIIDVSLALDRN